MKSILLSVVADGGVWEKQLLNNVVPVLACLKISAQVKVVTVGKAIAASVISESPLVIGKITLNTVFQEVQRQILAEFGGLDPLSLLEYFRQVSGRFFLFVGVGTKDVYCKFFP